MKSAVAFSAAAAVLSGTADAFWRMPCRGRMTLGRLDPIVDFGTASSHGHTIHGGSNFDESANYDMLRASNCTSCAFTDDKSAYWTPSLHFVHENGEVEIVPQIGGMLAYYQLTYNEKITAFPEGFQMLAGDSRLRDFKGSFPDLPKYAWTGELGTQKSLGQKAIGFNCLNSKVIPSEPARYRHFLPSYDYLIDNCLDGIRAEIMFPSCWKGPGHETAPDHKSHMAYPRDIDGGACPPGFPVRMPMLFYETIWYTSAFKGKKGQFTFSNGDPTGFGYHADFMNGWHVPTLQDAVDHCDAESGSVEDCPVFAKSLQSEAAQGQCEIEKAPEFMHKDDCAGPAKGLCGNVPIQYGPGYANPLKPGDTGKPTVKPEISSHAAVPTLSYKGARTSSQGVGILAVSTDAAPSAPKPTPEVVAPAPMASSKVYEAPAAPVITPAAMPSEVAPAGSDKTTTTYISAGIQYEVEIDVVAVTVTVTDDSYQKQRRHAHHRRQREHGLLGRN